MELAERTGLAKATVSRLTQTLVGTGFLQIDTATRAYRLGPATLSLAHAMRSGSEILTTALPLIRSTAQTHRINVGLAAPDQDEMVYLESIRYNPRASMRSVVSGQRVPMELTSLGRAYLSAAPEPRRSALLLHLAHKHPRQWKVIEQHLVQAQISVEHHGWCSASWQAGVIAVATPVSFQCFDYALNVSLTTTEPNAGEVIDRLAPILMVLKNELLQALARLG